MKNIEEILTGVQTLGIAGHIRPDGDCMGSCMGLYLYLKEYHPEISTDIYLEEPREVFSYMARIDEVITREPEEDKIYDVFVTLDVSAKDGSLWRDILLTGRKRGSALIIIAAIRASETRITS